MHFHVNLLCLTTSYSYLLVTKRKLVLLLEIRVRDLTTFALYHPTMPWIQDSECPSNNSEHQDGLLTSQDLDLIGQIRLGDGCFSCWRGFLPLSNACFPSLRAYRTTMINNMSQ
jgi:hypothetical protein